MTASGIQSKPYVLFSVLPKDQHFLTRSCCFFIAPGTAVTAASLGHSYLRILFLWIMLLKDCSLLCLLLPHHKKKQYLSQAASLLEGRGRQGEV